MVIHTLILAFLIYIVGADIYTTSGIFKGREIKTADGTVEQYLGIPYAQPPVGDLRFRPPVPLNRSYAQYDATFFRSSCIQPPHRPDVISPPLRRKEKFVTSEDCLYLNIYAPQKHKNLTVMVWLPGEGFDFSDSHPYNGTFLASLGKVIVVTVDYRLGLFGFLTDKTDDAPGNVALLDQRMALQWVKDNIASFGGDPERVTLFGTFTGAMSISIHLASPLHRDQPLFKRAIIQGGVATGDFAVEKDSSQEVQKLAELVGCGKSEDKVGCLRGIPAEDLLNASCVINYRWRPTIDGKFLPVDPMEALEEHKEAIKTDVIVGANEDSGSICFHSLRFQKSPALEEIMANEMRDTTFRTLIKNALSDYYKERHVSLEDVAYNKYRYLRKSDYLYNKPRYLRKSDLLQNYFEFCGDMYVKSSISKLARTIVGSNKVYMYQFSYRPSFSQNPPFFYSAAHGDDVVFTFGLASDYEGSTDEEKELSRKLAGLFTDFAKTGYPDRSYAIHGWRRYQSKQMSILQISSINYYSGLAEDVDNRIYSFWEELSPSLRQKCK